MLRNTILIAMAASASLMQGCVTVGNDFVPPAGTNTQTYRHSRQSGTSAPHLPGNWWTVFGDAALDQLERQALRDNPGLKASALRLVQAQAKLGNAKSSEMPAFGVGASVENFRASRTTPQATAMGGRLINGNRYAVAASMSYEFDVWGKVKRIVEAAGAGVEAAESDHGSVTLLLTTQVANTYWQLRGTEAELSILQKALDVRREARQLVEARFQAGLSNELDVARAEIELSNAQADLREVERQRNLLEHALATLVGASPSEPLPLERLGRLPDPPSLPPGLPANLLAQRPDLAGSVALMRSANAELGIAEAAFYPSLQLTGNWGYASESLRQLTESSSRQFSIGPLTLSLPIFDGGRNRSNLAFSRARYDEALANHQAKLLNALKEVEDALSDSEQRGLQAEAQVKAQQAAARAHQVALARYNKGLSNYLDVTDAQRSALAADRAAAQIHTQRLLASVAVVRALGGAWHVGRAN